MILAVVMIVGMMSTAIAAEFVDTADHWTEGSIDRWAESGIVEGIGGEIILLKDIQLTATDSGVAALNPILTIDKTITLNMNGKKISLAAPSTSFECTPVIFNITSGTTTITGNGELDTFFDYQACYGINVNGGNLVIEKGTFYGCTTAVQAVKGSVIINGGFFALAPEVSSYTQWNNHVINATDPTGDLAYYFTNVTIAS